MTWCKIRRPLRVQSGRPWVGAASGAFLRRCRSILVRGDLEMTSGQPDPSSLPKAAKGVLGRRGLMAGVAAATAGLLAYAQARNTEVAHAVDATFDNLTVTNINLNAT